MSLIPIRCFTCNKVIADKWEGYKRMTQEMTPKEAMDKLGLVKPCCRRHMLTHRDLYMSSISPSFKNLSSGDSSSKVSS